MIRNLHDKLGIPAETLIRPANLPHAETAKAANRRCLGA